MLFEEYSSYARTFTKIHVYLTGLHVHGLAYAASGYHRVLEENRKLYNQVQDLKGNTIAIC